MIRRSNDLGKRRVGVLSPLGAFSYVIHLNVVLMPSNSCEWVFSINLSSFIYSFLCDTISCCVSMADKYLLRVTAGPSYDASTHVVLPVNTSESTLIHSSQCTSRIKVRVQHYRGLPRGSPSTSPYFSDSSHIHDQYSISFTFIPHASVSGAALVFGNDFDRPIRDRLPPGFSTAFRIAKWAVDPGLDGDPYADKPYLYSPLIATITRLSVGPKAQKEPGKEGYQLMKDGDEVVEEGAEGDGENVREESAMPDSAAERKKWGLNEKESWTWEEGRTYAADFYNPYLDFNNFSLKLPGFSLPILGHLGGEDRLR